MGLDPNKCRGGPQSAYHPLVNVWVLTFNYIVNNMMFGQKIKIKPTHEDMIKFLLKKSKYENTSST